MDANCETAPRSRSILRQKYILLAALVGLLGCSHRPVYKQLQASTPALDPEPTATLSQRPFLDWPVDRARLTRGFFTNRRRPHLGIDLAGPTGTPVFAAHNGVVIYAGRDFRGFGKMIIIEAENGWASLYAHLDQILIQEGQRVSQGSAIAKMGNTGRSTGPHLHFELRKDKIPVDPLVYLPGGVEASRKLAGEK